MRTLRTHKTRLAGGEQETELQIGDSRGGAGGSVRAVRIHTHAPGRQERTPVDTGYTG